MKILLIDNYDSFTWNLHHLLLKAGANVIEVVNNDEIRQEQILLADALVFSPGPGLPVEAGKIQDIIRQYADTKKMIGICLGHQAIAEVFGARLIHAEEIFHGTSATIDIIVPDRIFRNIESRIEVGRYHSWIVDSLNFPSELEVTATDEKGVIMALRHRKFDITGMQFHPESILTPMGLQMIMNWLY